MSRLLIPIIFPLLLVGGCATDDGSCRKPIGDRAITPVAAAAGEFAGRRITWGGTLVEARHSERSTELEMVGFPLGSCGRPRVDASPVGRFVILRPGFLETADLRPGREITATGPILDVIDGQIGEASYRFPVLEDASPTIWSTRTRGGFGRTRPYISVGVGGGRGWGGGGVGVVF